MKLKKNKNFIYISVFAVILYFVGFATSNFYFFSLGLLPIAIYEWIRTEGKKNTKPSAFLASIILLIQFLHTAEIFPFPYSMSRLTKHLPIIIPDTVDQFIFISAVLLIFLSLNLIRYTWGSVTRLLAIILLLGSLLQGSIYWREIKLMANSQQGKILLEGVEEKVADTLSDRIKKELNR